MIPSLCGNILFIYEFEFLSGNVLLLKIQYIYRKLTQLTKKEKRRDCLLERHHNPHQDSY